MTTMRVKRFYKLQDYQAYSAMKVCLATIWHQNYLKLLQKWAMDERQQKKCLWPDFSKHLLVEEPLLNQMQG